jgi:hypothetical protein
LKKNSKGKQEAESLSSSTAKVTHVKVDFLILQIDPSNCMTYEITTKQLNPIAITVKNKGKNKSMMPACINLAGEKSIARVTLASMSDANKEAVDDQIEKTLKGKINREVKSTVLNIAHRELLELRKVEHLTKSVVECCEMIHPLKPTMDQLLRTGHALKVGDWVEIMCEYAPGTCSDGGVGEIMEISKDEDDRAWCTVSYVIDKRIETCIDQKRITVTIMPWKDTTYKKRLGRDVQPIQIEEVEERKYEPPNRTPIEWLQYCLKSRTHERRGWLKDKLLQLNLLEATPEALWKILWIHCDEKWFHGIVRRTNAKACPELGIAKTSHSAHHKKHIAKVMAHCCVGYLFTGDVEAGGDGFLISCDRCASFKMPLRNSYHSSRDPTTGKLSFKGNAVKNVKGVPYLVDCAVTGTDVGTATKPCFPLKRLWEYTLIPAIALLVDEGGPCEGAVVVVQQDNAGPHIEEGYRTWMLDQCDFLGWMYEPQAPQGITFIVPLPSPAL